MKTKIFFAFILVLSFVSSARSQEENAPDDLGGPYRHIKPDGWLNRIDGVIPPDVYGKATFRLDVDSQGTLKSFTVLNSTFKNKDVQNAIENELRALKHMPPDEVAEGQSYYFKIGVSKNKKRLYITGGNPKIVLNNK